MFSRAHLLIVKEQEEFIKDPPWGIEAWPMYDDTIFEWMAKIKGLRNTPWEGGIFKVYIRFDEHFSVRPPQIYFQTIPFHPNVEVETGRPCVDFLDDYGKWREDYSFSMVLMSLQALLSNPVIKNAVNVDAAQMWLTSPQSYNQMVLECVAASQRVEAGGSPQIIPPDSKVKFDNLASVNQQLRTAPPRTGQARVTKLSFEDYHSTWCGIATSKTNPNSVNPLLESIKDRHSLREIHMGLPREEVEELIKKQVEEHNTLVYGRFRSKQSQETEKAAKLAQLDRMKRIYLPPRHSPMTPRDDKKEKTLSSLNLREKDDKDGWENEVDDLVLWTHSLDTNAIDPT